MRTIRAYSIITKKATDDGARTIEGMATTPTPDRLGDIVEPDGAVFKTPLPLLWQHRSNQPIGEVTSLKVTKAGIEFKAKLAKVEEPGTLKDRLDEAWQSIKIGLVKGVSIGFSALERAYMKNGGIHFTKWEMLELSAVTIPANAEATITSIKSADQSARAASGRESAFQTKPGDTGRHSKSTRHHQMNVREKINALEEEIEPKITRRKSIIEAAMNDNDRDLTSDEQTEVNDLSDEISKAQTKLANLRVLEGGQATVKAVPRVTDTHQASQARAGVETVAATAKQTDDPGIGLARMVMCYAMAKGNHLQAVDIAKTRYGNTPLFGQMQSIMKAQVAAGTTTDTTWASALAEPQNLVSEFVEFLRPQTIVGKFGTNGIPSLRRVPFNIKVPAQISGGVGYWVGEGLSKPLTRFDFTQIQLLFTKVANIAVVTEELLRFSNPSAELLVRNALAEALMERLDTDFADPNVSLSAGIRPASVTNAAQSFVSAGPSADQVRTDIKRVVAFFIANNIPLATVTVLMRSSQALSLSLMRNTMGVKEFPDMTINGGVLEGMPVIASQYIKSGIVAFVVAGEVYLADDGGFSVDLSREASLEMDSDPAAKASDSASPPLSVESTMVSMFQTNSVAIRCERMINWQRRRAAAVAYLTAVGWGNEDTSPVGEPI